MAQDMFSLGECCLKKTFIHCSWMKCFSMEMRYCWLTVSSSSSISCLIFCLVVLFVTEEVLKSTINIFMDSSASPFGSIISFCFLHFEALLFGRYTFKIIMFSWWTHLLPWCNVSRDSSNFICCEVYIIWYEYSHFWFLTLLCELLCVCASVS